MALRGFGSVFRAQMSVEFFIIAGFILLAASMLISTADQQVQDTMTLNNVVAARNALDLEVGAAKYVYLQGNNSAVTNFVFVPSNTSCFNFNTTLRRFYCVTLGVTGLVFSDEMDFIVNAQNAACTQSGWLRFTVRNQDGYVAYSCTRTDT